MVNDLGAKKKDFNNQIEEFAKLFLGGNESFPLFNSEKIINDSVWGTHKFSPLELTIISLPIVQRLRQVRQMGFVNYVYPSAIHTRFEHSLGTAILSKKLFDAAKKEGERYLNENDLEKIRVAALLHDIGHCLYSHTSEEIYGHLMKDLIEDEGLDADPKPHEFFAYCLLKTDAFRVFFRFISNKYKTNINPEEISNYIIGAALSESDRYKVSFINGSFDADKLDYIYRDSRFSGLPLLLDLDRLMHEIAISGFKFEQSPDVKDLTIGISGVSCLEQIIFNKMLLFSTIYHHQKVKACDCMFKGVFEYLLENRINLSFRDKTLSFSKPTDFLWFTDTEFMAEGVRSNDEEVHRMIHDILYRRPLKRALVISRKTIDKGDLGQLLSTGANKKERHAELRELAKNIWENAGKPCSKHSVWIDIPSPPSFKEATTTYVRTDKAHSDNDLRPLTEFFPTTEWTHQYNTHKLRGHVFCPDQCRSQIAKSAKEVFEIEKGITFKPEALSFCKNTLN